jgi:hypothetical protein
MVIAVFNSFKHVEYELEILQRLSGKWTQVVSIFVETVLKTKKCPWNYTVKN